MSTHQDKKKKSRYLFLRVRKNQGGYYQQTCRHILLEHLETSKLTYNGSLRVVVKFYEIIFALKIQLLDSKVNSLRIEETAL